MWKQSDVQTTATILSLVIRAHFFRRLRMSFHFYGVQKLWAKKVNSLIQGCGISFESYIHSNPQRFHRKTCKIRIFLLLLLFTTNGFVCGCLSWLVISLLLVLSQAVSSKMEHDICHFPKKVSYYVMRTRNFLSLSMWDSGTVRSDGKGPQGYYSTLTSHKRFSQYFGLFHGIHVIDFLAFLDMRYPFVCIHVVVPRRCQILFLSEIQACRLSMEGKKADSNMAVWPFLWCLALSFVVIRGSDLVRISSPFSFKWCHFIPPSPDTQNGLGLSNLLKREREREKE